MIGDKDITGNVLRLGGKKVSVWEHPEGAFILRFDGRKEVFVAQTEKDALDWYNKIEDKNFFKLPNLPPPRLDSQKEEEPLLLPDGAKLLGKFESQSTPGLFHCVVLHKDSAIRCTCWPFTLNKTCNHYQFVKSALDQILVEKLIEKPITVRYNRETLDG